MAQVGSCSLPLARATFFNIVNTQIHLLLIYCHVNCFIHLVIGVNFTFASAPFLVFS